jgi:hypothetical protein
MPPHVVEATRGLLLDAARRATTRLVGAARRALKRGELGAILPALDAMLGAEPPTLAAMFASPCRMLAAVCGTAPTAERVAEAMLAGCRSGILVCVEGDDTRAALGRTFDGWETTLPHSLVNQIFHVAHGQDANGEPMPGGEDNGQSHA